MNSTSDSSKWTTSLFELDKKEMSLRPVCYKTKDAQYKYHYKLYPKTFHVKDEGMQVWVLVRVAS